MTTQVLSADDPAAIELAARVLREGGLVAFPTETVYGLGANALDDAAVRRIFHAKGRPSTNPLIVHVAEVADVHRVVATWPDMAVRLAAAFWPGPLTMVLPRAGGIGDAVTGGGLSVGVRLPRHDVARRLVAAAGVPIAAPSANRSTQLSATTAQHVLEALDGRVEVILDGGAAEGGIESTVIGLVNDPPRLLRPGLITPSQLQAVVGPITWRKTPLVADATQTMSSPGQMLRHYAPRTRLECHPSPRDRERVRQLSDEGKRVGWLSADGFKNGPLPTGVVLQDLPSDPAAYAARLYAALHELDGLGLDAVVVNLPPELEVWLAVHDRLHRASAR